MSIDDFKWWHWIAISVVLGLTVGYLQTVVGFNPLRAERRALDQRVFENELHKKVQGKPTLKDIRLYPDGPLLLLKFQRLAPSSDGLTFVYGEWQMTPPVPYRPRTDEPHDRGPTYTVMNYLADTARKDPSISYRYAWWATKPMTVLLWTAGSMVMIGGIWPVVVNLLIGAGFGRRATAEVDYDLSRFQSEKDLIPATVPNDDDVSKLRELEEEMLKNLQKNAEVPLVVAAVPVAPIKALDSNPLPAMATPTAEDDREFTGQFYPVTHGAKKKKS